MKLRLNTGGGQNTLGTTVDFYNEGAIVGLVVLVARLRKAINKAAKKCKYVLRRANLAKQLLFGFLQSQFENVPEKAFSMF